MTDPAYPMQVAIAAALLADAAVAALVGSNVWDPLSAVGRPYPLVEIGDDQVVQADDGMCNEVWSTIHLWCRQRLQTKQIAAAVRDVLTPSFDLPPLDISGHRLISAVFHGSRYLLDPDPTDPAGQISHGVLQFHFQTVPQNA